MKANIPKQAGMPSNMNDLMRQAQKMQAQMEQKQVELAQKQYTATSGGEMVSVTMSGKREILSLDIKPEIVDPEDVEMLSDMIAGAVNECIRKIDADSEEAMSAISGGAAPGLPVF